MNRRETADAAPHPPPRPGLREALCSLRCVQAGWAFGVPEDGREQWLDLVIDEVTRFYLERHGVG